MISPSNLLLPGSQSPNAVAVFFVLQKILQEISFRTKENLQEQEWAVQVRHIHLHPAKFKRSLDNWRFMMTFCVRIRLLISANCCLVYSRSQNSWCKRGVQCVQEAHLYNNTCQQESTCVCTHIHRDKGVQFQLVWDIFILCNKS